MTKTKLILAMLFFVFIIIICCLGIIESFKPVPVVWENEDIKAYNNSEDDGYQYCLSLIGQWVIDNPGKVWNHYNCDKIHPRSGQSYFFSPNTVCYLPLCEKPKHKNFKYYKRDGKCIEKGTRADRVLVWKECDNSLCGEIE